MASSGTHPTNRRDEFRVPAVLGFETHMSWVKYVCLLA